MSRQAQAEREKAARVILGSAEAEVAQKFLEAAGTYGTNPVALQLRAMNIIYEATKERGSTILIPSSMVDSFNVSGVLGIAGASRHDSARHDVARQETRIHVHGIPRNSHQKLCRSRTVGLRDIVRRDSCCCGRKRDSDYAGGKRVAFMAGGIQQRRKLPHRILRPGSRSLADARWNDAASRAYRRL